MLLDHFQIVYYSEKDFTCANFMSLFSGKVSEENSLFDTIISRRRRQVAVGSGFQPRFLSDLVSDFETNNPTFLASARSTCEANNQCLFDTLAAENENLGAATREMQETNEQNERVLGRFGC